MVDGPLLGNGDVGVVLSGPPEAVRFHFGKNDCWTRDSRKLHGGSTLLTVGGLSLETPALAGATYEVVQDIENAEVRGRFSGGKGALEFAAWMPRKPNLLVCELNNSGGGPLELTARLWAGDPQTGFADRAGQATLIGHSACWLTPCIDRFCGEIQAARVYATALTATEVEADCEGTGPTPLHAFPALRLSADPLPLARELPVISSGHLTLSVRVRPSADGQLRAVRKAAQPHGFTFHEGADVQFLVSKPGVFNLRLVDGRPAMTVGRLTAAADCRLAPGEWACIAAVFDGRTFTFYIDGKSVPTVTPDRVTSASAGDDLWFRRELDPDTPDGVTVAVAAACQGAASQVTDGSLSIRLAPGETGWLLTAVSSSRDAVNPLAAARRLAVATAPSQRRAYRAAQTAWWREYWDRAAIDVGDPLIHRYYYGAYYILACCCGDEATVAPGLFGNWITTDTPAWRGDYHLNYNYQAPWWGAFSGNRMDLAAPYDQPLLDHLPQAREHARSIGLQGVLYPTGIGPGGICGCANFWGQKSNAAYAAVNMIMRWQASRNQEYLRATAYDFVREVGEFWESALCFEDGRYVIRGDSIHEGSGPDVNPLLSLGFVRMVFRFLLETSASLNRDADKRGMWQRILDHISAFPTQERRGRRVFRLTEQGMDWAGANSLELQHVFPAGCIGLGSPPELLEIARETVRQLAVWDDSNSFPTFYTQAARVGFDPDMILEKLTGQLRSPHALPNLYLFYGGGGIESCGGITGAINEMLMQSHEGIIRLFPGWPHHRDAQFDTLRASGAFLVSSALRSEVVTSVVIHSEVGGVCRLANPFPGEAVVSVREATTRTPVYGPMVAGPALEWLTVPGGDYVVKAERNAQ